VLAALRRASGSSGSSGGPSVACAVSGGLPAPKQGRPSAASGQGRGPQGRGRGRGAVNPHTLIGGLKHLLNEGVDFLRVTVGKGAVVDKLLSSTELGEPVAGGQGFAVAVKRLCPGGFVIRRSDPYSKAKKWGLDYESWQWPGCAAAWGAGLLRGEDVKATRFDVAWDFVVDPEFMPADVVNAVRGHIERLGMEPGVSGPEKSCTYYIGARSSERMVRIYRKDIRDQVYGKLYGPVMRLEVELKGHKAQECWATWQRDKESAFAMAGKQLQDLMGFRVRENVQYVEERTEKESLGLLGRVASLINQRGMMMAACFAAGIPLDELCGLRVQGMSRTSDYRFRMLVRELEGCDKGELVARLRMLFTSESEVKRRAAFEEFERQVFSNVPDFQDFGVA